MSRVDLYSRVAARCQSCDLPVTAAAIADIDRYLAEERAASALAELIRTQRQDRQQ
jgi:hypothetical protein